MKSAKIVAAAVGLLLFQGCGRKTETKADAGPPKQYTVRGEIVALDASGHTAVINAEKIDGWMEAMTMEYPIKDPQEFQKLKKGETIRGTVFVQGADFWVGGISETPAGASATPSASK